MKDLGEDVGSATLGELMTRLRRRWWLVVLALVLGVAGGHALTLAKAPTYHSSATVLVQPTGTGSVALAGARTSSEINLDTEAQLVKSAVVGDAAGDLLASDLPGPALVRDVEVSVPPNSQVLSIRYAAGTAEGAQRGAQAFAEAYLNQRAHEAQSTLASQMTHVRSQLEALQQQLRETAVTSGDADTDTGVADSERAILADRIAELSTRLSSLETTTVTPGKIITAAQLPRAASTPVPLVNLAGGGLVGLLLGVGLTLLLDVTDRRIRDSADVFRRLGLPTLADVPRSGTPGAAPGLDHAGMFDRLRNSLLKPGEANCIVHVADPEGHGSSGAVALQLSHALARAGRPVLLVTAHPRSEAMAWAGLGDSPGLVDVLRGKVGFEDVAAELPEMPGVAMLPAGGEPEALEAVLQTVAMQRALERMKDTYGNVVVETLGTGDSAAAQAVAAQSDVVVLVAERGRSDDRSLREAAGGAAQLGATVAGVVLVAAPRREWRTPSPALPQPGLSAVTAPPRRAGSR